MYISGYAVQKYAAGAGLVGKASIQAIGPELKNLNQGDAIQAKVVSDSGDVLTMKTADGTVFTARNEGSPVPVGQNVELTVMAKTPEGLSVEISSMGELDTKAMLRSFGLPATRENITLVREMALQKMPLTEQSLNELKQIIGQYKSLSVEQAVFMLSNKIPVNTQSIGQFQGFLRQQNQIGDKLVQLLQILEEIPEGVSNAGAAEADKSPKASPASMHSASDASHSKAGTQQVKGEEPAQSIILQRQQPEASGVPIQRAEAKIPAQNREGVRQDGGRGPGVAALEYPDKPDHAPAVDRTAHREVHAGVAGENTKIADASRAVTPDVNAGAGFKAGKTEGEPDIASRGVINRERAPDTDADTAVVKSKEAHESGGAANQDAKNQVAADGDRARPALSPDKPDRGIMNQPLNDDIRKLPQQEAESPKGAGKISYDKPHAEAIKHMPGDSREDVRAKPPEDLKDMVRGLFKRIETGRGELLSREMESGNLKKELSRVLAAIAEKEHMMPEASGKAAVRLSREIEQSFRFVEQINNFAAYMQFPISLNGADTTAELYVFNDSKDKKKIDPQNATLFFSLGTANMGRVEVFTKVIGKNVECDFTLMDESAVSLLRGHMADLSKLLDLEGYKLHRTNVAVAEEQAGALEIAKMRPEMSLRYTLDRTL